MTDSTNAGSHHGNVSGSSAKYYDDRVSVRSPYTGRLDSPKIVVDYDKLGSSRTSVPAQRAGIPGGSRVGTETGYASSGSMFRRFRVAVAGLAIVIGIGAVTFTVMGAGEAPVVEEAMAAELPDLEPQGAVPAPKVDPNATENTITSLSSPIALSKNAIAAQPEPSKAPIETATIVSDEVVSAKENTDKPEPELASESTVTYDDLLAKAKKARRGKARISLLREAVEVNPQGDEALAKLSILLMELPRTRQEALGFAEQAVEINHENAAAWLAIGYIKQLSGARVDARKAYAKCAAAPGPKRYVRDCRSLI